MLGKQGKMSEMEQHARTVTHGPVDSTREISVEPVHTISIGSLYATQRLNCVPGRHQLGQEKMADLARRADNDDS